MSIALGNYQGDPGLFGFIGKGLKAIGKGVLGVAKGAAGSLIPAPLRGVAGAVEKMASRGMRSRAGMITSRMLAGTGTGMMGTLGTLTYAKGALMGGTRVGGLLPGQPRTALGPFGDVTGGGSSTAMSGHFGGYRKYRRMNAGNAKALRKAIRRVVAFQKLASQVGFHKPPAKLKGVHNPRKGRR